MFRQSPDLHDWMRSHGAGPLREVSRDMRYAAQQLKAIGYDLNALETAGPTQGVTIYASSPVVAGRAVTAVGKHASIADITDAGRVLGVAAESANATEPFGVVTRGLANVGGFTQGDILYLAADGELTVTPPTAGFQQRIGIALSASVVLVSLGEAIVLA